MFAALRSTQKEPANMVSVEKRFYERIAKELEDYRGILSGEEKGTNTACDEKHVIEDVKKVKVRFLAQLPAFIGIDMVHYGPFKEGDMAEVPKENAQVLVYEEAAEEV